MATKIVFPFFIRSSDLGEDGDPIMVAVSRFNKNFPHLKDYSIEVEEKIFTNTVTFLVNIIVNYEE